MSYQEKIDSQSFNHEYLALFASKLDMLTRFLRLEERDSDNSHSAKTAVTTADIEEYGLQGCGFEEYEFVSEIPMRKIIDAAYSLAARAMKDKEAESLRRV